MSISRNDHVTGTRKTFLLINANPKDQVIFVQALSIVAPDIQFFLADNSVDALEIMLEDNIIPDCIVVELATRGINAMDFLREVKKMPALKHVPVIVHSARPVPHKISQLKRMGAYAIYCKPYDYWGVCNVLSLYVQDSPYKASLN